MHINFDLLEKTFTAGLAPTDILLGSVKLLDVSSRSAPAFQDNRYLPFYYHLGKLVKQPVVVHQVGVKLGLIAACFMQGCDYPVQWNGMEEIIDNVKLPKSIINSNLKKFSKNGVEGRFCAFPDKSMNVATAEFPVDLGLADLAFLTDKYDIDKTQNYLELLWEHLNPEGLLVVDYIHDDAVKTAFEGFCRVKNREPVIFNTRYRIGIVTR